MVGDYYVSLHFSFFTYGLTGLIQFVYLRYICCDLSANDTEFVVYGLRSEKKDLSGVCCYGS